MRTFNLFRKQARTLYSNKYTYHADKFTGVTHPTVITCPYHGDFSVRAGDHLNNGIECPKCSGDEVFALSIDDFASIVSFDSTSH